MGDTPPIHPGRARGRARGRAMTSEQALAALRKPGDAPPQAVVAGQGAAVPGRGRGVVSSQRGERGSC